MGIQPHIGYNRYNWYNPLVQTKIGGKWMFIPTWKYRFWHILLVPVSSRPCDTWTSGFHGQFHVSLPSQRHQQHIWCWCFALVTTTCILGTWTFHQAHRCRSCGEMLCGVCWVKNPSLHSNQNVQHEHQALRLRSKGDLLRRRLPRQRVFWLEIKIHLWPCESYLRLGCAWTSWTWIVSILSIIIIISKCCHRLCRLRQHFDAKITIMIHDPYHPIKCHTSHKIPSLMLKSHEIEHVKPPIHGFVNQKTISPHSISGHFRTRTWLRPRSLTLLELGAGHVTSPPNSNKSRSKSCRQGSCGDEDLVDELRVALVSRHRSRSDWKWCYWVFLCGLIGHPATFSIV